MSTEYSTRYGSYGYGIHEGEDWIWPKVRDTFSRLDYADSALQIVVLTS